MFCFCSNEMQPCRIWGAKQKLNPIANSQSPIAHLLYTTLSYKVRSHFWFFAFGALFFG